MGPQQEVETGQRGGQRPPTNKPCEGPVWQDRTWTQVEATGVPASSRQWDPIPAETGTQCSEGPHVSLEKEQVLGGSLRALKSLEPPAQPAPQR